MKKDMETIKVYESYWKSDTDLALSLTIVFGESLN